MDFNVGLTVHRFVHINHLDNKIRDIFQPLPDWGKKWPIPGEHQYTCPRSGWSRSCSCSYLCSFVQPKDRCFLWILQHPLKTFTNFCGPCRTWTCDPLIRTTIAFATNDATVASLVFTWRMVCLSSIITHIPYTAVIVCGLEHALTILKSCKSISNLTVMSFDPPLM